jgi:hypothetical protein
MAPPIKLVNFQRLARKLEKLKRDSTREDNGNVNVGFEASYALFVHEAPMTLQGKPRPTKGRYWDPQGRATNKFLEGPFRELQSALQKIIETAVANGVSLIKALLFAGLRLQREAQKRVPVDTGNLKGSAFTAKE